MTNPSSTRASTNSSNTHRPPEIRLSARASSSVCQSRVPVLPDLCHTRRRFLVPKDVSRLSIDRSHETYHMYPMRGAKCSDISTMKRGETSGPPSVHQRISYGVRRVLTIATLWSSRSERKISSSSHDRALVFYDAGIIGSSRVSLSHFSLSLFLSV